jgi:RNA polymerase sigma-70 factor (sigma-E family)
VVKAEHEESFRCFAEAAMPRLRRLAFASGRDPHRADDLVQSTLEKMYAAWPRVERVEDPGAYARTVLVRTLISEQRRRWWRAETSSADPHGEAGGSSVALAAEAVETRLVVAEALARLPERQRLVVVLRFLEDLSVAAVAELLRCSEGTVKSTSHDAVKALRVSLDFFAGQRV